MSVTKIVLDRQAKGKSFTFGDTSASGAATVVIEKGTSPVSTTVFTVKGSQQIDGNLVVTGDLLITGSIDEQSVTNLTVKDKVIIVNKGGVASSGGGSGLAVEEAGANSATILFDSSLTSKWKAGATGSEAEIVTTSAAQTLTNKTIAGSQITGNITGNAANVTGTVGISNGGTGGTTAQAGRTALLPTQTGNGTKFLQTDGTDVSWQTVSATKEFKRVTVTGTQDGSNKTFTLSSAVTANSEQVILNGQILSPGGTNDYTLSGTTLTFTAGFTAPDATDVIQVMGSY